MSDAKLNVKFTVRDEGAPVIERIRRKFRQMGDDGARAGTSVSSAWQTALGVFAGVGAVNVASAALRGLWDTTVGFMADAARLAEVQETAERRLEAVLRATGGAVGYTADQLKRMAAELQDALGIGDEEILRLQAVMLTFRNVTGDTFREAIELTADMAFVMGTDARSAAIQLGKALNDPIQGVSALRRVGVSFTEQQKEQIRALQESGNLLGAQKIILAELRQEFGGVSREMDGTWGRATTNLASAWGDLKENLGDVVTKNPAVVGFLRDLTDAVKDLTGQTKELNQLRLGGQLAAINAEIEDLQGRLRGAPPMDGGFLGILSLEREGTLQMNRKEIEGRLKRLEEQRKWIQRWMGIIEGPEKRPGETATEGPAERVANIVKQSLEERKRGLEELAKQGLYPKGYSDAMRRMKEVTTADLITMQQLQEKRHQEHLDRLLRMDKGYSEKLRRLKEITAADLIAIQEAQATAAARPAGTQEDIVRALTDNATTNPLRRLKEVSEEDWRVIKGIQEEIRQENEQTASEAEEAAKTISHGFSRAFSQALVYGESFSDQMRNIFKSLAADVIEMFSMSALSSVFGLFGLTLPGVPGLGALFGLGGGGSLAGLPITFHEGGVIPRAHTGLNLRPDEVPIIAQTGERVLSREQNREFTEWIRREREDRGRPAVIEITLDGRTLARALVDLAESGRLPVALRT